MGSERRARQKANRAKKLEEIQKVEQRDQRRQYAIIGVLVAAGIAGVVFLLSLGGDDEEVAADDTSTTVTTLSTTTTELLESAVSAPESGGSIEGPADCPAADGSSERITSFAEAPPMCIDENASYTAEIDTTAGLITVELDAAKAPETVNNFVFLSR